MLCGITCVIVNLAISYLYFQQMNTLSGRNVAAAILEPKYEVDPKLLKHPNSTDLLGEILIYDDGSDPPIVYNHSMVRIVRSDIRSGLIQARNNGGNEARCEFIAIMDAHIKVAHDWLRQPYEFMKKDYKTVVNPVVFSLDHDKFEFMSAKKGVGSSAGLYWSFKHKWGSGRTDGSYESGATMGEFFVSKRWWTEVEGMDTGMTQWGGENIDFSLRTWLCGGRILVAPKCYIAHAFRTKFPYKVSGHDVWRNSIRSAEVWLDEEYKDTFYKERQIKRGSIDYGDLSKPRALKKRLKCHDFKWYVDYFKGISPCHESDKQCGYASVVSVNDIDKAFWDALNPVQQKTLKLLQSIGQQSIIDAATKDGKLDSLCDHASQINSEYPGGLKQYVQNAKTLLDNSTKGINPYDGFTPSIPEGKNLEFGTREFCKYEAIGLKELKHAGFVLVAGGLGERLGYEYIKISLHSEISTETPFIELYIKTILSYQQRTEATMLPLFIMTSDRTDEMTRKMLAENNYYGMKKEQITICKQNAVPAMVNKDGLFAYENGKIVTKPHGHGDVHLLMHQSGTASRWYEMGINWVVFFQDTNGLAFHGIPACVGVAKDMDLEVNSLAVRRYAKEKVGAICKLSHEDGRGLTINVEYNQLDPLLRATVNKDGDVAESNGFSPYPGNINVLCMNLKNYTETLEESGGSIPEFVNPKFNPDNTFKSPTRLECMMQDYPKLLGPKSKVGFTSMERWLVFSAVKNDLAAAKNAAASCGVEESAASGERDIYKMHVAHLNAAGCHVEEGAHVVIDPSVGVTYSELTSRFGGGVYITKSSTLVVKGDVRIENLELDGTLIIDAKENTNVIIRHLKIKNDGWEFIKVDENDENEPAWNRIRGYCLDKKGDSVRIYCGGEFVVDEF